MDNVILALPSECWRWHPEFKGIAQVSTRGDVKTVDRWVTDKNGKKYFRRGKILKPARDKKGYLRVALCRDGKARTYKVHRLVAETWLDNPEGKPQVNHRDEDKTNNSVENLEWTNEKENTNWGTGVKRRSESQSKPIQAVDPSTGVVVFEFPSIKEAGRKGFGQGSISKCCRGIKYKTYKGFMWRYKE